MNNVYPILEKPVVLNDTEGTGLDYMADYPTLIGLNVVGGTRHTMLTEMEESTFYHSIQRCPSSGYCSAHISKCTPNASITINSLDYQNILNNKSISAIKEAEEKITALTKEAREQAPKEEEIENAAYDVKSLGLHVRPGGDTRTPGELLDFIEAKGREIPLEVLPK